MGRKKKRTINAGILIIGFILMILAACFPNHPWICVPLLCIGAFLSTGFVMELMIHS